MPNFIEEVRHLLRGSCFTWSLSTALGITEEAVIDCAKKIPECQLRAYYRTGLIMQLLDSMKVKYSLYQSDSFSAWCFSIDRALDSGNKVLLLYNADHGKILTKKRPTLQSGHYLEILSTEAFTFTGRQSNVDGEKNGVVVDKRLEDLYESSCMFDDFTVDYGKLRKCRIEIPKHEVGLRSRCGCLDVCPILKSYCRFKCDMGGAVLVLDKEGVRA